MMRAELIDQHEVWEKEYADPKTSPVLLSNKPSSIILEFAHFLTSQGLDKTNILDLCCGRGRNAFALAELGFQVDGADFSREGLAGAKKTISRKPNPKFWMMDLTKPWTFASGKKFQAIVDCFGTVNMPNLAPNFGRNVAIDQSYEHLTPGAYYLFYGAAPTKYGEVTPGPEVNSSIFPNGKFEKQYSEEELKAAYKRFNLVQLDSKSGSEVIAGVEEQFKVWVAIFQRPAD